MRNLNISRRSTGPIFVMVTIFSLVFGQIILPYQAHAISPTNKNLDSYRKAASLNDRKVIFDKTNSSPQNVKSLSSSPLTTLKKTTGLKKSQQTKENKKNYVEGEILVKYRNNKINLNTTSGRTAALNFTRSKSLEKKEDLRKNNISVLRIKDTKTVEQKIAELKNDPNVEYTEPNYKRYITAIDTNDINKNLLWGLDNAAQTVGGTYSTNNPGSVDKDIDAPEAWVISESASSTPVIVAIIDTGVAYSHPDLIANMWDGTSCKDENGVVIVGGCNHGYDYENNDNTPLPTTSSHGTHIAGTIAAAKNNSKGIIGVSPQTKIMAIKFGLDITSEIKAIDFAIQNGAKVINASFGGNTFSQFEYDAINRFKTAGGIFVAAAGNSAANNDGGAHHYPSDFDLDNIISVAATDQNDALASFSNYGATSIDVGAPGVNIYSTIADSVVANETFEGVISLGVPTDWVKGGALNNWGVLDTTSWLGSAWGKVLYSDLATPYANDANTTVTSPVYNLSAGGANIDFWTKCDTEYITDGWADYMALEFSSDGGSSFTQALQWDEAAIDSDINPSGSADYHFENLSIPNEYLTSNFKLRFRWVTDSSVNNYGACLVDDIKITKYSDGSNEQYGYSNGTSMATPHVAGLAALIEGYNPTLSLTQVKDKILTTGDSVASLSGKTVSGKRINAQSALLAAIPTNPATVNLGTAGNYVILAKTAITTTGSTAITGDIGISPVAATAATGFGLALDSSGTFSTSSLVTGRIYAADYTEPTPTALTADVIAMQDAYTNASGRTQDELDWLGGTLPQGTTFTRGIYKWGTNVSITGDITLSGGADDVWIFIITGNLDISTSKKVLLSGGAQTKNIFWVVAGTTTIQPGSTFEGNILGGPGASTIAMQSGAILHGRALGQTDVTLIANTVTTPTPSFAKAITAFTIPTQVGTTTINESTKTIAVTMPFGTVVTALVPTFTITGSSIAVGVTPQVSATTPNNFTSPVTYVVTAADGSTQNYIVTITVTSTTTHTISGTIKYYGLDNNGIEKKIPSAILTLENDAGAQIATTTTDVNGAYQLTGITSGGNYVVRASKSDNTTGLSSGDQIKIGRHKVGLEPFNTIYKTIAGDVNNDGSLTSGDQIKIGRFIVGLDSNLPSGAWKFYLTEAALNITNYLTTGLTRIYTNLIADTLNQDFIGIKMGDVNNSWQ